MDWHRATSDHKFNVRLNRLCGDDELKESVFNYMFVVRCLLPIAVPWNSKVNSSSSYFGRHMKHAKSKIQMNKMIRTLEKENSLDDDGYHSELR